MKNEYYKNRIFLDVSLATLRSYNTILPQKTRWLWRKISCVHRLIKVHVHALIDKVISNTLLKHPEQVTIIVLRSNDNLYLTGLQGSYTLKLVLMDLISGLSFTKNRVKRLWWSYFGANGEWILGVKNLIVLPYYPKKIKYCQNIPKSFFVIEGKIY